MTTIKIIVAHHKKAPIVSNDSYLPIHVGKKLANIDLGIEGDDTGDNISIKNPIYCEMSAMYWAWKNITADYIGLCHYRRYFTTEKLPLNQKIIRLAKFWATRILGNLFCPGINYPLTDQITVSKEKLFSLADDFIRTISKKLNANKFDIVVSTQYRFSSRTVRQLFETVGRVPIQMLEDIVKEKAPKLYPYLMQTFNSDKLFAANMFIMSRQLFNEYSESVFSVLEEHELRSRYKYCSNPLKDGCYSRLSGYLAECLTSAFILQQIENNRAVLYVNTIFCKDI